MNRIWSYAAISVALLFCKCTAISYLPKEEYYYDDTEIVIVSEESKKTQNRIIDKIIDDAGMRKNQKFLGSRPEVWCYYIAGEPKEKAFIRYFVKNTMGSAPVFLSQVQPKRMAMVLEGKLGNEGYLTSKVTYRVDTNESKRSAKVVYNISLQRPYYLGMVRYPPKTDSIYTPVFTKLSHPSMLSTGQQYSLTRLEAELDRVENGFKNSGFYFFSSKYLLFEADSTNQDHLIDLDLTFSGPPPRLAGKIYKLTKPVFYFDPPLPGDTATNYLDTLSTPALDVVYNSSQAMHFIRPDFLASIIDLKEDRIFTLQSHETTRNLLMDLGLFQSISIKYTPTVPDSGVLNPSISLGFQRKKNFQSDLKIISKSNGTIGPYAAVTFTDRNLMKGAEKLDVTISGGYETQISNKSTGTLDAIELKLESSLVIKKLLSPLKPNQGPRTSLPSTIFKAGVNFQNRIDYYDVSAFNASAGYSWQSKRGTHHQLFPIDLSYLNTRSISEEFYDLLALNPSLAISLQDQFIIATRYAFTIGTRSERSSEWEEDTDAGNSFFRFKGTLEQAGNLLDAAISKARDTEERPYEIMGSPYSQHVRAEANVSYYWTLNRHEKIVSNILGAAGYAYGNLKTLPYVKQFSIGGASSIRAFPARTIGPGSYNYQEDQALSEDTISFTDQLGDIALQGNIEYRFDIHKIFKGALFVDAGNIWTFREDSARAGSQFKGSEFYKQFAVGAGAGLRIAPGVLVLRFDIAVPLKRQNTGWLLKSMDWGASAWRKENIVFNIAIGYPF